MGGGGQTSPQSYQAERDGGVVGEGFGGGDFVGAKPPANMRIVRLAKPAPPLGMVGALELVHRYSSRVVIVCHTCTSEQVL